MLSAYILLPLIPLIIAGCFNDPLQPVAPTWDINLTIPIANRHYSLLDVMNKSPKLLEVGPGNLVSYAHTARYPSTFIGDRISIDPAPTSDNVKLGAFRVSVQPFTAALALPWLPAGALVTIPDTTFGLPDVGGTINTFQNIICESGTLTLTLQNNLPVPVVVTDPITFSDSRAAVLAFVFAAPGNVIPPNGGVLSTSADLAGKDIDNTIRLGGFHVRLQPSLAPVRIPAGDLLTATMAAGGIKVNTAVQALIPAQMLVDNDIAHLALNDSTRVQQVGVKTGIVRLSFVSRINLDMTLKFRFPEIDRGSRTPPVNFEDSLFLPALGTGSYQVDLRGDRMHSTDGGLIDSLSIVSSLRLPGSAGRVTVNDTDKVFITFTKVQTIVADTASVVLKPTWVAVDSRTHLDFGKDLAPGFSGQLNIPAARLRLNALASFGFPMDLYVSLTIWNSVTGQTARLDVPAGQRRLRPGSTAIQFDSTIIGPLLSQFGARLPDSVRVLGIVLINPADVYNPTPAGVGSIGANSSLTGSLDLNVPLRVGLVGGAYADTVVFGDTSGSGVKSYSVDRDAITKANTGTVYCEVENGFPMQVGVKLGLLNAAKQSILALPQPGAPVISVGAAQVDAQGVVLVPARSSTVIALNSQEVQQFTPAAYVVQTLTLATTSGSQTVQFETSDSVKVRIWSSLSYRVNK